MYAFSGESVREYYDLKKDEFKQLVCDKIHSKGNNVDKDMVGDVLDAIIDCVEDKVSEMTSLMGGPVYFGGGFGEKSK